MNISAENYARGKILPELEKGRPGVDRPHTEAVVYHMKAICQEMSELDCEVLIVAAYAHDWGYTGLFKEGVPVEYEVLKAQKPLHMEFGAEKTKKFLENENFDYLTPEQKDRIVHLVRVHDKVLELEAEDEIALMEADTLGGLDTSFYSPTFNKESNSKYMESVRNKRFPRFRSAYGKKKFEEVFAKRLLYYEKIK